MARPRRASASPAGPGGKIKFMTVIVTWNIQYGKGVDGVLDLSRIVDTVRAKGDFDVLCVQEIAVNYADMGGGAKVDQTAQLADLLPGYAPFFGAAVDRPGPRACAAEIRQHDPVAAEGAGCGDAYSAAAGRRQRDAHAAQRRGGAGRDEGGAAAGDDHASGIPWHGAARGPGGAVARPLCRGGGQRPPRAAAGARARIAVPPPAIGTVLCGDFNFEATESPYGSLTTGFTDGLEKLSRCLGPPLPGAAARPDLRHLRCRAMAARTACARFHLCVRRPCEARAQRLGRYRDRRLRPSAGAHRARLDDGMRRSRNRRGRTCYNPG